MSRDPFVLIPAAVVISLALGVLIGQRLRRVCACQSRAAEPPPALPAPYRDPFRVAMREWEAACDRAGFYVEAPSGGTVSYNGGPATPIPRRHYPAPPPGWFAGVGDDTSDRKAA